MNKNNRQTWLAISCLIWASSAFSATQGALGSTSSGSFSITLIVHPSLEPVIEQNDSGITDSITVNEPTDFCVSGRGINQYSLSATARENQETINSAYELAYKNAGGNVTAVTRNATKKFNTMKNCDSSSSQLSLQVQENNTVAKRLPGALNITIHAE